MKLDHRRDVQGRRAVGGSGGDDLAGVVDGHPGPQPERRLGQADEAPDRRVEQDRQRPEQRDRRHGIRDLARPCPEDRRGGGDRGVAAYGRPDRQQDGEAVLDLEQPGEKEDERHRDGHRDDDRPERGQPDPRDLAEAQACAEQHDAGAQQRAGGELDPGLVGDQAGRTDEGGHHGADDQRDRDLGHDRRQQVRGQPCDHPDEDDRAEPRAEPPDRREDAGPADQEAARPGANLGVGAWSYGSNENGPPVRFVTRWNSRS